MTFFHCHRVGFYTQVYVYYTNGEYSSIYTNLQADQWYHFAIVVPVSPSNEKLILYQDGENIFQKEFSVGTKSPGSGDLVIGRRYTNKDGFYVNTDIDELVFWNLTLSGEEIKSIYDSYNSNDE